jgi:hypothetical protein
MQGTITVITEFFNESIMKKLLLCAFICISYSHAMKIGDVILDTDAAQALGAYDAKHTQRIQRQLRYMPLRNLAVKNQLRNIIEKYTGLTMFDDPYIHQKQFTPEHMIQRFAALDKAIRAWYRGSKPEDFQRAIITLIAEMPRPSEVEPLD